MIKFDIDKGRVNLSEIDGMEATLMVELIIMNMVLLKQIAVSKERFNELKEDFINCISNEAEFENIISEEEYEQEKTGD